MDEGSLQHILFDMLEEGCLSWWDRIQDSCSLAEDLLTNLMDITSFTWLTLPKELQTA